MPAVPWFWSDIGDMKLQMVGLTAGSDRQIVSGEPAENKFSVFHFAGDRLIGIESVNRPADHMLGRKMMGAGLLARCANQLPRGGDALKAALADWQASGSPRLRRQLAGVNAVLKSCRHSAGMALALPKFRWLVIGAIAAGVWVVREDMKGPRPPERVPPGSSAASRRSRSRRNPWLPQQRPTSRPSRSLQPRPLSNGLFRQSR